MKANFIDLSDLVVFLSARHLPPSDQHRLLHADGLLSVLSLVADAGPGPGLYQWAVQDSTFDRYEAVLYHG